MNLRRALEWSTVPLAMAALAVALWLPPRLELRPAAQAIVFLDISQSMDVTDVALDGPPVSRLEAAKASLQQALRRLPCGSRIGLGAFTEARALILLLPVEVCASYADLLEAVTRIDGGMRWGNASQISLGVTWAIRAIAESAGAAVDVAGGDATGAAVSTTTDARNGDARLVFISDGHEAPPRPEHGEFPFNGVKPGTTRGWLVGVGGDVPLPIPRTLADGTRAGFWRADEVVQTMPDDRRAGADGDGDDPAIALPRSEQLSHLHEARLQNIAQRLELNYRRLDSPRALQEVLADPDMGTPAPVPIDMRWVPVAVALGLLVLRFLPPWPRRPARRSP